MVRRIGFGLLWLAFVIYAFFFAPPNRPETFDLMIKLSTFKIDGINPIIVALFNLLGIWPLIYSCVLFIDGRGQKLPAWLFASLSFGVGAFILLPYLALRDDNPTFLGDKNLFLKVLDSRWTGLILLLSTVGLVAWGVSAGDWRDFIRQWQTSRFVHVMSLDFVMVCCLFPALLRDDMARRGMDNPLGFWAVSLVPLFGPLVYLCTRKPLAEIQWERVTD